MADLVQLPLADIDTNGNIRADLGDLADMTRSVSDLGVLTPVTVYRNAARQWVLLAGHRRVEAALRAGLSTVPALDIGDEPPDEDRLVIALVENLLREDLNPIDEARAYQQLASRGWSTRKVAAKLHIHHSHVASRLSLLALPPDIQSTVTTGDTRVKHAYQLARLAKDGVPPDQLTDLATQPADVATAELEARKRKKIQQARIRELKAEGLRVVPSEDLPFRQTLPALTHVDRAEHRDEPCHIVAVRTHTRGDVPHVALGCADPDRHPEPPDKTPEEVDKETAQYRARMEHEQEQSEARTIQLGRQLAGLDGDALVREALAVTAHLTLGPIPPDDSLLTGTSRRSVPRIGVCPPEAIRAANTHTLALAIVRHHLQHQDRQRMWGPNGDATLEILQRIEQRLAAIPPDTQHSNTGSGGR